MAQPLSLSEINCVRKLSPHFELGQLLAGTYSSPLSGEPTDSAQIVVRGDLARVARTAYRMLGRLLLGIVSLFFVGIFLLWSCDVPSDATLRSQFQSDRSELEALVRMSQEDADGMTITYNFGRLESNLGWARAKSRRRIPREKWDEYRELFRQVHLSGLIKDKAGNVYLVAAAEFTVPGATKGFVHCIHFGDRDQTFLPCLERHDIGQVEEAGDKGYSYRHLEENWYIFETWAKAARR
ncbi:MAG: hypothetical protein ABSG02_02605 [Terriglobales bacterium]|jgi:hypothetical protein